MTQSLEDETARERRGWDEQEKRNPMVPGHRALYKKAGITKLQIQIGRTKLNKQTPEQEHKSRIEGLTVNQKRRPDELVLDEKKMKELVDWMWRTRRNRLGDEKILLRQDCSLHN